jgi:hypothetical protein
MKRKTNMGLLESAVFSVCIGSTGAYNTACHKAVEAEENQSGFSQTTNAYENHQLRLVEKDADEYLGADTVGVIGGLTWIGKSISAKKATFGLPNLGICSKLVAEVNEHEARLIFKWFF